MRERARGREGERHEGEGKRTRGRVDERHGDKGEEEDGGEGSSDIMMSGIKPSISSERRFHWLASYTCKSNYS